jgi:hypothetical protein
VEHHVRQLLDDEQPEVIGPVRLFHLVPPSWHRPMNGPMMPRFEMLNTTRQAVSTYDVLMLIPIFALRWPTFFGRHYRIGVPLGP